MPAFGSGRPANELGSISELLPPAPPGATMAAPPPSEAGSDAHTGGTSPGGPEAPERQDTFASHTAEVPTEPDSGSLLQGSAQQVGFGQAPLQQSGHDPASPTSANGLEQEQMVRGDTTTAAGGGSSKPGGAGPPCTSITVPRRCTAKDPFWVAGASGSSGSQRHAAGASWAAGHSLAGLRCLGDVIDAADRDFELEVPEAELSTVHIETWEQRLDWRSFLSEAVASSRARQLFKAFDVEAEPPQYARPPPSSSVSALEAGLMHGTPSGRAPVHCVVAPSGAGLRAEGAGCSPTASGTPSGSSQLPSPLGPPVGSTGAGACGGSGAWAVAPVDWSLAGSNPGLDGAEEAEEAAASGGAAGPAAALHAPGAGSPCSPTSGAIAPGAEALGTPLSRQAVGDGDAGL